MKLWAVALSAKRQGVLTITSGAVARTDDETARGAAFNLCKEYYSPNDGWTEHGISVNEIPEELINIVK
jgi:hypothetical protein